MRRIIILITSMFLFGTLAAENFYWMNGSGNWEDPAHWSTDQNQFESNGEIPGENDIAFILDNGNDQTIQINENITIASLHWEAGKIESSEGAKLTVLGEIYTSETVSDRFDDQTIVTGSDIINGQDFAGNLNNDEEKFSAQTPNNNKSTDKGPGYEIKAAPTISAVNVTNASCNGLADGIIEITVDDADEYSIDNGASWEPTNEFSGLSAGNYTVLARKGVDETAWAGNPVEITEPDPLSYDGADITNVTCKGADDGTITINVSGGTAPYTYDAGGALVQTGDNFFDGLPPSGYTFEIRDDNGCPVGTLTTPKLIVSEALVALSFEGVTTEDVSCGGEGDGELTITVSGGQPDYTYRIEGQNLGDVYTHTTSNTTYTFTGLDGDDYSVTVTDAYGCVKPAGWVYTVSEPPLLEITGVNVTDVSGCAGNNNGGIQINAVGGSGTKFYSINGGTSYFPVGAGVFSNLTAGDYNVQVKDQEGCETVWGANPVTIDEPDSVKIDGHTITQPTCFGDNGTVTITAVSGGDGGPYEYSSDGGTNWQAGNSFSLPEGSYNIIARDGNLCESEPLPVVVDAPDQITFTATPTDVKCNGGNDGQIVVSNVAGGSGAGYEYSNDGGATFQASNTFLGLTAGTYDIVVRDGNLCESPASATVVDEPDAIAFTPVPDPMVSCNGGSDGVIEFTNVTGGTAPYEYSIDGGATWQASVTFNNLSADTYNTQVRDANLCTSAIQAVDITEPGAIDFDPIKNNDVTCNGGNDGEIEITNVTGGTSPFTYSNNGGSTWQASATFSNLSAGDYDMQVRDVNLCVSAIQQVTITEPAAITFTPVKNQDVTCNGGNDGEVEITLSAGGTAPYTYSSDGGATWQASATFSTLTAGTHNMQVKDVNNCLSAIIPVTVIQPDAITFTPVVNDNVSCNGGADGEIEVTNVAGGTAPYEYRINAGAWQAGAIFAGLMAGDYDVEVRDVNLCTAPSQQITVTEPDAIAFGTDVTNATCNGADDGIIEVINVTGGTSPYQYSNDGGATWQASNTFSGLAVASYDVQVRDVNLCTSPIQAIPITEPDPIDFDTDVTNITCNAGGDGEIEVINVTGGTAPYEYSNDGGATWQPNPVFSTLIAGDYDMQVRDGNLCVSAIQPTTVTEPDAISFDTNLTHVTCNGGSDGQIEIINVTGGTPGYEYSIDKGTTWQAGNTFVGLSAGNYNVVVRDANLCESDPAIVTITEPDVVDFDPVMSPVSCNGLADGEIEVTNVTGGTAPYTYSIDGGVWQAGATFAGLAAGDYDIQVQDVNNCLSAVQTVTVTEPDPVDFDTDMTPVTCNGGSDGSIEITNVTGGTAPFEYSNDGGATWQANPVFGGLAAATYNMQVRDANLCTSVIQATDVTEPDAVTFNTNANQNVTCNGGTDGEIEIINVTGGIPPYEYSNDNGANWQGSPIFSGLIAGTYDMVVRDANLCVTASQPETITEPDPITFTPVVNANVTCFGGNDGEIEVTNVLGGTPGYEYSNNGGTTWQASPVFSGLIAGDYTIVVRDVNLCESDPAVVTITEPDVVDFTPVVNQNVTCNGGSDGEIEVTAVTGGTPGYTYSKDGGATWQAGATFAGLAAGDYDIQVRDVNLCLSAIQTVTVTEPDPILFDSTVVNVSCNGGNDGSIEVTNVTGGTAPFTYSIDGGAWQASPVFNLLTAGTYDIQVRDANLCLSAIVAIEVTDPDPIDFNSNRVNVTCNGGSDGSIEFVDMIGGTRPYEFSIDGGTTFQNDSLFENLIAGNYNLIIRDANLCLSLVKPVTLLQPDAITFDTNPTNISCNGGSDGEIEVINVLGGSNAGFEYSNDNGATFQGSNIFSGLIAGTYDIVVRDGNGCLSPADPVILTEPDAIAYDTTLTNITCNGGGDGAIEVIDVLGGTAPYEYSIDNGTTYQAGALFENLTAGIYDVVVRDANLCLSDVFTATLTEPDPIVVTLIDSLLSCGSLPVIEGDTLALPDGGGVSYETTLTFTDFDPGQTLNAGDIAGVFIDIEHSYPGDLIIELVAPDNSIILSNGRGGTRNLGYPVIGDEAGAIPGDGYTYTFDDNASKAWTAITSESHYYGGVPGPQDSLYTPAGRYIPENSFDGLAGTAMNGEWKLRVTDQFPVDNGFIFKWGIRFNESAYPANYCNGMLEVVATGGNGGFTYDWSTGQSGVQIDELCADGYTVTVTDAAGCSVEYTDSVYDVDIEMIVTDTTHVLCAGDLTGSATVAADGGNPPYSYAWDNGATGPSASGLAAGWYTITVTDFNSCEYVDSVEIKTIYDLNVTFSDTIPITCSPENLGDSTGGVTVTVSGGTAPFTYNWSSSDGDTNVATNLVAGWNYVTVSDPNCSVIDSIYMDTPDAIQINEIAHQDVLCFGDSTGSITITVDNGEAPLLVEWSHTTDVDLYTVSDLAAGDYTVTVTDSWACMEDTTISILQPADSISFDLAITNSSCSVDDGEVTATVTGGTGPYVVTWYDNTLADIGNGVTISGLGVGDYFVGVEDANLCTTSLKPFSIEHDTDLEITGIAEVSPVSCNGGCDGEYVVEYTGGVGPYNFSWSNGQMNDTATNLCGDSTYTITIIDSEGCMVSFDTVIPNPALLTLAITDSTNVLCLGGNSGEATATAAGGTPDYTYIWTDTDGDTVATTSVATNLYADTTYNVEVTDARGCQATTTVTLTQPATAVTATIDVTETDCDVDNGTATINAVGGTPYTSGPAYEYLWQNGETTATIADLGVGSYPFTVYDSLGCEYLDTAIINSNSDLLISLDDVQGTTCFDACDGSASITVTGGSGDFTYEWPGGIFIEDPVDTLCGGTNTVIVTNNVTGCQILLDVNIPQPAQLLVDDVVTTPALCAGDTTGTAAIVASGGTPFGGTSPYTYLWEDGSTDSLRNDLAAGPYSITVFDANMCEATFDFVINEPNPFSYDLDIVPADCGIDNGSITVSNINGGDGNYTVTWSHPDWTVDSVGFSITNLSSDNYTMMIQDGNLCDTIQVVNMPNNTDLLVSLVSKTDPTCADACDGQAEISITGGTEPYTITWSNGATDVLSANDLCDGVFTVIVVDDNNCSFEFIDSLRAPDPIAINDFVYTKPIECAGDSIADLYVAAEGGTGEFSFIWENSVGATVSADSILTNAIAGSRYYVTITDENLCEKIDSIDIPEMPDSLFMAFNTGLTNCPEDSTGWAAVDVTGGVGPYTFNWYKSDDPAFSIVGNDTDSASSLAFGYYVVEITDMLGCTVIDSVIVQSNTTLAFDVEILQEVTCDGNGSATIANIVDGVGPFDYLWSSGEVTDTAFALSVGTNSVMLTDNASSCSVIREFEMSDDSVFDVRIYELRPDYITGTSGNGLIRLEATGGFKPYTYEWADENGPLTDNDSLLYPLDQGMYYYTVTDAQGCTISDSAEIIETSIYIQDTLITNVSCFGYDNGAITIVPAGGVPPYTVNWNDGTWATDSVGTTITNLTAGTYYLTITDLFSSYEDSLVVTEPQPYVYNENITAASCSGADGQIIIEVESGGTEPFTYTWEYNGYPELDPEGLTWAWPSDTVVVNDTITDLHVGYYYFTLVDGGGCTTVDSVFVPDNSDFAIDPIALNPNCLSPTLDNGSISLNPENGADPITYYWSHDATLNSDVASNLAGGDYAVTVIDNNLCVRNDAFTLTTPVEVDFEYDISEPVCSYDTTGTVTITPIQGNGEFQFAVFETGSSPNYQSDSVFLNLGAGQYIIRVLDEASCIENEPVVIESETSEIQVTQLNEMPGCPTDSSGVIRIEVQEGLPFVPFSSLSYEWMIDSATLASWGASEGMYDSIISTDSVVLNARPGVYNLKVTTGTGCIEKQDVTLMSDTSFVFDDINMNLVDTSIFGAFAGLQSIEACKYEPIALYAAPYAIKADPYQIIEADTVYWSSGAGLGGYGMSASQIAFDTAVVNQSGTNYYVARIEAGRCYMEDSIVVNVPDYPDVVASVDDEPDVYSRVFEGGRTTLVVNSVTDSTFYTWSEYWEVTGELPPIPTIPVDYDSTETEIEVTNLQDSTIYTVLANTPSPYPVSNKYCTTSDTVKIRVMGEFNPPSAFSPNGDGTNDTWILYGIDVNFSFNLKIYNRWGQLVFESKNANEMLNEGWDGTNMNGNDVTIGTYYYVIEYSDGTKTRKANGPVTVIR